MDQQCAQVHIAPFADPKERGLPTARVLSRYQPEPSRYLPAIVEASGIGNRGNQCRSGEWSDAGDLRELAAEVATSVPGEDLALELTNLPVELFEMTGQSIDQLAKPQWQFVAGVLQQPWHTLGDVPDALRDYQTKLPQQASDLVRLGRASLDEPLPHAVER